MLDFHPFYSLRFPILMQDLYINEMVKNLKKTGMEYGFRNENWRNTHGVKIDRNQAWLCQLPHSPPAHFLYHGSTYFRAFKKTQFLLDQLLKETSGYGNISKIGDPTCTSAQTLGFQSGSRSEGEYFCLKTFDDLPSFAVVSCALVFD